MATKNQQKSQEPQAPETVTEKNNLPVVNENPYAKKSEEVHTDNETDAFAPVDTPQENVTESDQDVLQPIIEESQEPQAPETVTEPIKPTLTDNVVSTSTPTSNKIQNKFGVVVGISGMAARLLEGMDKNTKFVK